MDFTIPQIHRSDGQTLIETIAILVLVAISVAVVLFFARSYIFGNKQLVDFKYDFNVAYVLGNDSKFERTEIKAWKDWNDSDAIQIVLKDGKPIYTHLRNVKLTHE